MADDSDGVAYLSPRHLGTMKAILRFTKYLPATTMIIAYAQYDDLVLVNFYCTVTFDRNTWCMAGSFRRP